MKKILVSLFCVCAFVQLLTAQDLHHELAIDMSPLVKSSNGFTMMYRYHAALYAYRVQANVYYENTDKDRNDKASMSAGSNSNAFTHEKNNVLNAYFRLGIQRSWNFDKWGVYAGADLLLVSTDNEYTGETTSPNSYGTTRNVSSVSSSSTGFGLAPVFGFSYRFNPHFTLALENSVTFVYTQQQSTTKDEYYFTPVNGIEALNSTQTSSSSGSTSSLDLAPAKYLRLFIGFRF